MTRRGPGWATTATGSLEGRRLVLGGIEIAHDRGLAGHSDADVLTHAIIDALLGAAALGDIGEHFPDTDERYRGADSLELLRATVDWSPSAGSPIGHVDATVMIEQPHLAPFRERMRSRRVGRARAASGRRQHQGDSRRGDGIRRARGRGRRRWRWLRSRAAMNRVHNLLCSSDWWARRVEEKLVPWGLNGVDLGEEVLEVGPGFGATTRVLATMPRS